MTDEIRDPREVRSFQEDIFHGPPFHPVETDYFDFSVSFSPDYPPDYQTAGRELKESIKGFAIATDIAGFTGETQYRGMSTHSDGTRTFNFRRMRT